MFTMFMQNMFTITGKSDDPFSPDFVPSVNLGYFTVKTPSASSIDRFDRFSRRNYEKTLREMDPIPTAKRQLDFGTYKDTDLVIADALLALSTNPSNQENKENRNGKILNLYSYETNKSQFCFHMNLC